MPDQDVSPFNHRSAQIQRFDQNDQNVPLCKSCGSFRNFSYQYDSCFGCGVNFYTEAKPGISSSAKSPPPSPFSCSVLPATPARAHFVQTSFSSTVTNRSREAGATAQPSPPPTRAVRGRANLAAPVDRATRLYRNSQPEYRRSGLQGHAPSARSSLGLQQEAQTYSRSFLPRRSAQSARGKPSTSFRQLPGHGYKGVRTRKGVKGFLVEIRPPKWKNTIWLGTYNTLKEAASAFDAGVFYTKKTKGPYNFDFSEMSFPPLPSHLTIENSSPEIMKEIKTFVKKQAQDAAERVKTKVDTSPVQVAQCEEVVDVKPSLAEVAAIRTSASNHCPGYEAGGSSSENVSSLAGLEALADFPETCPEIDGDQVPLDWDYNMFSRDIRVLGLSGVPEDLQEDMIADYTNYHESRSTGLEERITSSLDIPQVEDGDADGELNHIWMEIDTRQAFQ